MVRINEMKNYELAALDPELMPKWWQVSDQEARKRYASKHPVLVPMHQAHNGKWVCNFLNLDAPQDEEHVEVLGSVFRM